jgi:hypothetical protein
MAETGASIRFEGEKTAAVPARALIRGPWEARAAAVAAIQARAPLRSD